MPETLKACGSPYSSSSLVTKQTVVHLPLSIWVGCKKNCTTISPNSDLILCSRRFVAIYLYSYLQSVPSFAATSFSNVSPAVAQPSYSSYGSGSFISAPSGYMGHASSGYVGHVSSGYAAHAAPVAHAAPAYGLSTPCVAAGHGYRPITSLANEPMVPTTFASNANQAQVLDAADGSVDNKFFGSRVVTGF